MLASREKGRKGKEGDVLRRLGCDTQLQLLLIQQAQAPGTGPRKSRSGTQGRGREAGLMGRSLHKKVAHRDAQKSVHSSNQRFLK